MGKERLQAIKMFYYEIIHFLKIQCRIWFGEDPIEGETYIFDPYPSLKCNNPHSVTVVRCFPKFKVVSIKYTDDGSEYPNTYYDFKCCFKRVL